MEAKNEKSNTAFQENAEQLGNLFNKTATTLNEIYKSQLNLGFNFYSNIFNSAFSLGKNNWGWVNTNPADWFMNDGKFTALFNPLTLMRPDTGNIFAPYENLLNQVTEYNRNWLETFQRNLQSGQNNWLSVSGKYQQLQEARWEAIQRNITKLNEAYSKQLGFSLENNRETLSELNKQFTEILKSNTEFWESVFKAYGSENKKETEEKSNKSTKKEQLQVA